MRRENEQNKITKNQEIQKKSRRVLPMWIMVFIMITGMMTGCDRRKKSDTTELIPIQKEESDQKNTDSGSSDQKKEQMAEDSEKKEETTAGKICYVHICGAVKCPGVYELMPDGRLYEAIQMAGGLTDDAAGEALNQAERIEDGSRIYVPTKDEVRNGTAEPEYVARNAADAETSEDVNTDDTGKVNINTASKEQLMALTGIGEAKAASIIRYREEHGSFQKVEDLMEVEGIKEGVFQKVKDQIKI